MTLFSAIPWPCWRTAKWYWYHIEQHTPYFSFDATIESVLKAELGGVRLAERVARDEQLLRTTGENLSVRSVDAKDVGVLWDRHHLETTRKRTRSPSWVKRQSTCRRPLVAPVDLLVQEPCGWLMECGPVETTSAYMYGIILHLRWNQPEMLISTCSLLSAHDYVLGYNMSCQPHSLSGREYDVGQTCCVCARRDQNKRKHIVFYLVQQTSYTYST